MAASFSANPSRHSLRDRYAKQAVDLAAASTNRRLPMQCGRCAGDVFLLDTSSELDVHLVCAECGMPQSVASKADHDRYRPIAAANESAGTHETLDRLHR
jgi:hypothetical protein